MGHDKDTPASTLRQRSGAEYDDASEVVVKADERSPGVKRIEAVVSTFTTLDKVIFFAGLLIWAYGRGTGMTVIATYQSIALDEWGITHKSGMIGTVRQALTSASLPIFAKLSDYIGRLFVLGGAVTLWIVGPILVATAGGLAQWLPGYVMYTLGHVAANIMNYAIAIDTATLRNRLLIQFLAAFPSIINVWAGGVIAQEVVDGIGWRWGAGMWSAIIPFACTGLFGIMAWGHLKAKRRGLLNDVPPSWRLLISGKRWIHLFWVMDLVGLFFLAAAMCLILLPFTLGGGSAAKWRTPNVIVPFVLGVLCIPVFAVWELKFARHPIFPFKHMKDRHVASLLLLSLLSHVASSTRGSYLYFTLVVSFNQSVEGATRIRSVDSFATTLTIGVMALILRKVRRVKPFIISGACVLILGLGLLIRYRGGYGEHELAGLVAGEILDGIGSGMMYNPGLVALQAKLSHEHALLVTSCYAIGTQMGGGIANAIAGGIWTNMLPDKLRSALLAANIPNAAKEAQAVYKSPLSWVKANPPGSPAREAVLTAYRDVQRNICIAGICFAAVCLPLAFMIDDVRLVDKNNLVDDVSDSGSVDGVVPVKEEKVDEEETTNRKVLQSAA